MSAPHLPRLASLFSSGVALLNWWGTREVRDGGHSATSCRAMGGTLWEAGTSRTCIEDKHAVRTFSTQRQQNITNSLDSFKFLYKLPRNHMHIL